MKSLSQTLEKLMEKYPDDKDVSDALEMSMDMEDPEMEDMDMEMEDGELDMELGLEMGEEDMGEESPMDLDSLLGEDLGEEEDEEEEEMPPKKKKKMGSY